MIMAIIMIIKIMYKGVNESRTFALFTRDIAVAVSNDGVNLIYV